MNAPAGNLILCLLEPHLELLLGHPQVLDVDGGTVQKRNLAELLVRDGEGILEATVAVPELIQSPLLRLDALTTYFPAVPGLDACEMNGHLYNRCRTHTSSEAVEAPASAELLSLSSESSCLLKRHLHSRPEHATEEMLIGL